MVKEVKRQGLGGICKKLKKGSKSRPRAQQNFGAPSFCRECIIPPILFPMAIWETKWTFFVILFPISKIWETK